MHMPMGGLSSRAGTTWWQPGVEFGARYHVVSILGEGGMGSVYNMLRQRNDDEPVLT